METREELLQGLYFTRSHISKIINESKKQREIVALYRQKQESIGTTGILNQSKILVGGIIAAVCVMILVGGLITGKFGNLIFMFFLIFFCV